LRRHGSALVANVAYRELDENASANSLRASKSVSDVRDILTAEACKFGPSEAAQIICGKSVAVRGQHHERAAVQPLRTFARALEVSLFLAKFADRAGDCSEDVWMKQTY